MNNLISLYMNYKIQRLIEYGVFLLDDDSEFIRRVFEKYFSIFIDNYYYGIFYTIEDSSYSFDNLHLEFQGIMEEMLDEYRQYELEESNEEYTYHINAIKALKDYSLEILTINFLEFKDREEITTFVSNFIEINDFYRKEIGNRVGKFTKLVRDTYRVTNKLLNYEDNYFNAVNRKFIGHEEIVYYELNYNIKMLNNYRKTMVSRVYLDDGLEKKKIECLIQKISLYILKNILDKKEMPIIVVKLDDSFFNRGKIDDDVFNLIDNPLFRKYVYFGVTLNTYLNQKSAFLEEFNYVCIQDFSHINDPVKKVESVEKEGVFNYLIISDYKYKDRDYLLNYDSDKIKLILFEED